MARFYPIYVRRSDGKLEVVSKGHRKESNQPTDEQMDQRPDKSGVSDFYREVTPDEVKHLDWRRKLGGMLARELQWKDKSGVESAYILVTFPQNYRLFEHIKKSEKDGKTEVKSKTHAAGGNDRQDAYLYGHPSGRRKRYRSPADYFPHLLWLCTDETADPDNCSCKICCPDELENIIPAAKAVVKPEKKAELEARPSKSSTPLSIKAEPVSAAPAATIQDNKAQTSDQRQVPGPSPLPRPRSIDQQLDSQYSGFKYRQGELCWFRRGQAWGLGVILRRWNQHNSFNYTVQPLSFPTHKQLPVTLSSDDDMRPWLAWSVPRYTFASLNDLTPVPQYDTIDWQALAHGRYGAGGDLDVDGSILAAKSIDCTYTPFEPMQRREPQPGTTETYYNGVYLGAEKIWRGEPVRLGYGPGTDVLVVQNILERKVQSTFELFVIGDVYTLTAVPHKDQTVPTPASPLGNPSLPQRMTEDLAYRNARSVQIKGVAVHWKFVSTQTRIDINHVKGRWYEASIWLPILQPDTFKLMNERGDIQELSLYMNSRGDCLQANRDASLPKIARLNFRRGTRLEAYLQAVPSGTKIIDGSDQTSRQPALDPHLASNHMDIDPMQHHAGDDNGNLDQFMNLDTIEGHGGYY